MTTREKTKYINDTIDVLNSTFFKPMKAEIAFSVDGTNKYSLILKLRNKRLKNYGQSFYTYDDVISALNFITDIFMRYSLEKKK